MIFDRIVLYLFRPFRAQAGIRLLDLTFEQVIQIILGTNGSGKSSLLRECTALPARRGDYDAGGFKEIHLRHNGARFVLKSDFANKNSPHRFEMDGVNLNEGGTTQVQEDLVRHYLGCTPEVESIITGRYKICSMVAGQRKNLLMALNPNSLSYAHDRHKAVASAVRACKANLAMLQDRKVELESKFLDPAMQLKLSDERERLAATIDTTLEYALRVGEQVRQLEGAGPVRDPGNTAALVGEVEGAMRALRRRLPAFSGVKRDTIAGLHDQLTARLAEATARLSGLDEQGAGVVAEIHRYQERIAALSTSDAETSVDAAIAHLQGEIARLGARLISDPFSASFMPDLPGVLGRLQEITSAFVGCQTRLVNSATLQRKRTHLSRHLYRRGLITTKLSEHQQRIDQLRRRTTIKLTDIPAARCAGAACPLFASFKSQHDASEAELGERLAAVARLTHKLTRLELWAEQAEQQLRELDRYGPHLAGFFGLLQQYGYVRQLYTDCDLLVELQRNAIGLYERVRRHYEASLEVHRHRELQDELAAALAKKARMNTPDASEKEVLTGLLDDRHAQLARIDDQAVGWRRTARAVEHELGVLREYREALATAERFQASLEGHLREATRAHEHRTLSGLKRSLDDARAQAVTRLGAIDRILKDQEILQARHAEEVVAQIAIITAKRDELCLLEEALSPASGIPHGYTLYFVNALIQTINFYIRKVFVYPLAVEALEEGDALDYRFSMKVGEERVPDISEGSEAQQEMINLAFCLSLMRQLQLSDYPIYLDESGRSFDSFHKQRLVDLLRHIVDEHTVSQLFLINHHSEVHDGLPNANVLVLSPVNVLTPPVFNTHVAFEYY